MGDILDLARADASFIINDGGFQVDITFNPGPSQFLIKGLATKHHLSYDEEGLRANVKQAHITINEADLVTAGYTTRNQTGEIHLIGLVISYADSTGTASKYVIIETYPNETLGHIVCILGDFKE